jgi:hypothetical protein
VIVIGADKLITYTVNLAVFFFVLLYNKKGFLFEIKWALFETGDEEKSIKKNESRNENWRI